MLYPIPGILDGGGFIPFLQPGSVTVIIRPNARTHVEFLNRAFADIIFKTGDRLPPIKAYLRYDDDSAINLSGCTAKFKYRDSAELGVTTSRNVTVVNSPLGLVSYDWSTQDSQMAPGYYEVEFEILFPDGRSLRVPTDGYIRMRVLRGLV